MAKETKVAGPKEKKPATPKETKVAEDGNVAATEQPQAPSETSETTEEVAEVKEEVKPIQVPKITSKTVVVVGTGKVLKEGKEFTVGANAARSLISTGKATLK